MSHMLYGPAKVGVRTQMLPVAASQYFRHGGVNAVYLDSSGHVTLALTATASLYGFAIVPAGRGAGTSDDYWLSSATAGKDKIAVVPATEMCPFIVPADDTVTDAMRGNACDLTAVNDGTATYADVGTSSTDVFIIQGKATDVHQRASATDVVIIINPAKIQADT